MHRSALRRGDVVRYGHHPIVILEADGGRIIARDDQGDEGLVDLPEEVLLSGYAGEGIYAHLALDDEDHIQLDRIDTALNAEGES